MCGAGISLRARRQLVVADSRRPNSTADGPVSSMDRPWVLDSGDAHHDQRWPARGQRPFQFPGL